MPLSCTRVIRVPAQVVARDLRLAHAQQDRRGRRAVADEGAVVVARPGLHRRTGLVDHHVRALRAQHVDQRRVGQRQVERCQSASAIAAATFSASASNPAPASPPPPTIAARSTGGASGSSSCLRIERFAAEREGNHDVAVRARREAHAIVQQRRGETVVVARPQRVRHGAGRRMRGDLLLAMTRRTAPRRARRPRSATTAARGR